MSNRKLIRATQRLLSQIHQFAKKLTRSVVLWLLRGLLLIGRQPKPIRGFVLPTTILLLLLLTLTVGAITLRTYNRTNQAIGERQQRVIYNAATPAIDRAKAKLEYLFNRQRDPRFPSGIPPQGKLQAMLRNDGADEARHLILDDANNPTDPYTFPDEEDVAATLPGTIDVDGNGTPDRLDLDEDGTADNAWAFRADTDGDGEEDATVAYSILMIRPPLEANGDDPLEEQNDGAIATRADRLEIRHAPLSLSSSDNPACNFAGEGVGVGPGAGWFEDPANSSLLRKNFQVDVYVLPDNNNGTVSTLEFHQDRQMEQGNKWGAWFRNDLEIFPGPRFNWNGAMHTEGNLIVGNENFRGFLISSPASCLYNRAASEVTIADVVADQEEDIPRFQGQFMSGQTGRNDFTGRNYFHIHGNPPNDNENGDTELAPDNDSVPNNNPDLIDYTLDPIVLTTEDVSVARNIEEPDTPENFREADWADRELVKGGRLFNRSEEPPYVDDAFRADNRYGPKPRIRGKKIPGHIGEPIAGNLLNTGTEPLLDDEMIRDAPPVDDEEGVNLGLDGYWDRRARNQGMRILVSQRLELGNAHGWGGGIDPTNGEYRKEVADEPLMPWDSCDANPNNAGRCHETRQRRALYDNLAAVQAAVFYHADGNAELDFPTACMASTVHPGTAETLILSGAFRNLKTPLTDFLPATGLYSSNATAPPVVSNFFLGTGTNGWEYEVAPESITSESDFGDAIANTNHPLGKALRNLAYFAGDPQGGTPSFEPVDNETDDRVHPYPWLSMWGDFSVLRRVLAQIDGLSADEGNPIGGTVVAYEELSPADKATLHASACMIGMLAYNVGFYEALDYSGDAALMTALNERIGQLNGSTGGRPAGVRAVGTSESIEGYIAGLKQWNDVNDGDVSDEMVALAEAIVLKEQIARDRRNGFYPGQRPQEVAGSDPLTAYPNIKDYLAGDANPVVKFPSLKYIFPGDIVGAGGATNTADGVIDDTDNFEEEEIDENRDGYDYRRDEETVRDRTIERQINDGIFYQSIDLSDETVLEDLAVLPKASVNEWVLPHADAGTGDTNLSNEPDGIFIGCLSDDLCTTNPGNSMALEEVGFKDSALFNGREMLPVRVLDMNLELLRQSGSGLTNNRWIPNTGVIYAFREDAVREDMITRPSNSTWAACGSDSVFAEPGGGGANCYMDAGSVNALDSIDPPLNDENRISPKAVDYYPDPDRRPHGFRLRNGEKLSRDTDVEGRGMSFITDDPVYIQGDFNLHQDTNGNRLEEFNDLLDDNFNNFYDRDNLNGDFARPATDEWRPSEILADAITIISDRFCDGSIEDITRTVGEGQNANLPGNFLSNLYGCEDSSNRTSYVNMNRPERAPGRQANTVVGERAFFLHSDPYDLQFYGDARNYEDDRYDPQWFQRILANTPTTPIIWSRNGNPVDAENTADYDRAYYEFTDRKPLITNGENRVNAIIISGLTPSRRNQSYGGLHNFPRFIENWDTLFISGSLLQLSFSQYATAPFSQKAWEPAEVPPGGGDAGFINYYNPPERRWGYDVGLQYAPAGPLAERFISIGASPRSEFYSEPPADDPYMINLCQKIADDPDSTCAVTN